MEQINISRSPVRLQTVLSLKQNPPLYQVLSSIENGFVTHILLNYRVGLIITELLKYVKAKKLFQFPSTINCNEALQKALKVQSFQITQLAEVILAATTVEDTPTFGPHEEFVLQALERATILRLILELNSASVQEIL